MNPGRCKEFREVKVSCLLFQVWYCSSRIDFYQLVARLVVPVHLRVPDQLALCHSYLSRLQDWSPELITVQQRLSASFQKPKDHENKLLNFIYICEQLVNHAQHFT